MALILPRDVEQAKKNVRVGAAIRAPRAVEVEYRKSLLELGRSMGVSTRLIGKAVNSGQSRATVIALIQAEIAKAKSSYERAAEALPSSMAASLSDKGREQVEGVVKRSLGVDFARVVDGPEIADQLATAKLRNAKLITKLPEEHWSRVIQAVADNYDGTLDGSLTQNLSRVNGISSNRAKLIARDQTSKLSSDLARIRQEAAGIDSYIWRTSKDERVVGNPGGLYPKGNSKHGNHFKREGEEYKWSKPPHDGNPGTAIQCRCRAEPVINLEKLNATFV